MINEANQILTHDAAAVVVQTEWKKTFPLVRREVTLPNARVADVIAQVVAGDVYICEVKHALKSSLIEEAMAKYSRYCNYLYLGIAGATDADIQRSVPIEGWPMPWHRVGIIGIYPSGLAVLRSPAYRQIGRLDWFEIRTAMLADAGR